MNTKIIANPISRNAVIYREGNNYSRPFVQLNSSTQCPSLQDTVMSGLLTASVIMGITAGLLNSHEPSSKQWSSHTIMAWISGLMGLIHYWINDTYQVSQHINIQPHQPYYNGSQDQLDKNQREFVQAN